MRLLLKLGAILLAGLLCGGPVEAAMLLSAPPSGPPPPPVNVQGPQVSGSIAAAANTLTCSGDTWTNGPITSTAYAWFRDGSTSIGTNSANYTTVSGDLGHLITCKTTASNATGPAASASPASNPAGNCTQSSAFFGRVWVLPATLDGVLGTSSSGIVSGGTLHLGNYDMAICNLVQDGVWAKLDALWTPATAAATGSSQAVANLNLVSSSFTLVPHGSPTFTANAGYTGGAEANTTVWVDTGYVPATVATGGGQWQNTSAHLMGWAMLNYQSVAPGGYAALIGGQGPSNTAAVLPWTTANTFIADVNYAGSNVSGGNTSAGNGSWLTSRTTSTAVTVYRNGTPQTLTQGPFAATGNPNGNLYMLGMNNNGGTIVNAGPNQLGAASAGAGLTAAQVSSSGGPTGTGLVPRICTFLTAVHSSC